MMQNKRALSFSVPFIFFVLAYTASSFYLFYRQCLYAPGGPYLSDMPAYLEEAQGLNTTYSFPYHLFFWTISALHRFLPIEVSGATATVLFNSLNLIITFYFIKEYFSSHGETSHSSYISEAVTAASLLVSMQILPVDSLYIAPGQYFIGQGSGNIWHNATYIATRPFATATFFLFANLLDEYEKKTDIKRLILFSLSLFLTTFTKPSFSFAFLAAAAIILLWRLIHNHFSTFKQTVILSLAVIPTLADLLRQYASAFFGKQQGSGGIAFGFSGMQSILSAYTVNLPFSLLMTYAFPLLVLIFFYRHLNSDAVFSLSWIIAAVAKVESMVLYETGFRMLDGNFNWGNQHALYFLMISCLLILCTKKSKRSIRVLCFLAYMWHLISGTWYYLHVLTGGKFY